MATRRFPALAVVAALALAFVAALLLSRRAGEPEHGPLRPAEATRVAGRARAGVDPLKGLAAVSVDRGASTPVALGRSEALEVGDQVVLAGVVEPVVARFAGQATVQLGSSILSQVLLDL